VKFRILGPLEAAAGGHPLDLGGMRQQTVLATLLLEPRRVVTTARLMQAIYGDEPPITSRSQVQICISALRRLFAGHGRSDVISTHSQGYIIQVSDEQIDSLRFEDLVRQAREARATEDLHRAVDLYREALALWRGPVLNGIQSRLVQAVANRFTEHRITVGEDCLQLELDLGRHREIVGELAELVEADPLRERLRGLLMIALYRSGRQAEALQVYRTGRRIMIDELGIEPNEQLQRLEHAILTSDQTLAAPPAQPTRIAPVPVRVTVPRMLPSDIADFTGRAKEIDAIRQQLLLAAEDRSRFAVPIIVVVGKAGIGKSAVTVHTAHSVAERFPDGQLYADLHGCTSRPVGAAQLLERFLRVLGVPGNAVPETLDERAEMYRGLIADRKTLVVLDDAGSASQVLPLIPGDPTAAVIVTSRSRLPGLAGAVHVEVDVFDSDQSLDLLARIAGTDRVRSEERAAAALAELCGQLPLALRIAGARLFARPHWSVEQLAARLKDETRRLDELKHGEMGIRASISMTYESTGDAARRLFRRLAILDVPAFSSWVAAALLDRPLNETQDLLDDLADAQLIEAGRDGYGVHSQYRFHELIRVFAREQLATGESARERGAALTRVLGGLLFLAEAAHRREYGGDYAQIHSDAPRWPLAPELVDRLVADPLSWYERERPTLVAGIRQAAQAGLAALSWDLAITSVTLFESRAYLDDWRATHEIALAATRQARDRRGQAAMQYSMGSLCIAEQRFDEARRHLEAARDLFGQVGDDKGRALVIRNIGLLDRLVGQFDQATTYYEQALEIFRATGDQVAAAYVLHSLAQLRLECDDLDGAELLLSEALQLSRTGGSRRVEAQVLHRTGHTRLQAGEPAAAIEAFDQALAVVRSMGDQTGEAYALHGLGIARLRRGEFAAAEATLHQALSLANASNHRLAEARVQIGLGELAQADGRPRAAVGHFGHALSLFTGMQVPLYDARTLMLLSGAHVAAGDEPAALGALRAALAAAEKIDSPIGAQLRAVITLRLGTRAKP
jgi:DNA-binding SARP family transcriptional activator/Tfp pilus assembly protein PilF